MILKNYNDPKLSQILEKIIPEFKPQNIYLFGSRKKLDLSNTTSDYDLFLVIDESTVSKTERTQKAIQLTWKLGISVDFFIYTKSEFNEWKNEVNSIAHTALVSGLELEFV